MWGLRGGEWAKNGGQKYKNMKMMSWANVSPSGLQVMWDKKKHSDTQFLSELNHVFFIFYFLGYIFVGIARLLPLYKCNSRLIGALRAPHTPTRISSPGAALTIMLFQLDACTCATSFWAPFFGLLNSNPPNSIHVLILLLGSTM